MSAFLTKSKYLAGLQCPLLLWCQYHRRDLFPPVPPGRQAIFDQGHEVGEWAKRLHPDGVEVPLDREAPGGLERTVALTRELLPQRRPIFEASFQHGRCYCRVDLLLPAPEGAWDLVEVKSGASVKPVNLEDVAFQVHCLRGAGLQVRHACVMHVNTHYVRRGEIQPARLLWAQEVDAEVEARLPGVPGKIARCLAIVDDEAEPAVAIDRQCDNPYDCDLQPHCWAFLPADGVDTLYRARRKSIFALIGRGLHALRDVPEDELSPAQRIQRATLASGLPHVDAAALRAWLGDLRYPLHLLDFETVNPAVPLWDETRPYQPVPFQFSLHVLDAPGTAPRHFEFLAETREDPRPGLLAQLAASVGPAGTVLAYNSQFEVRVLQQLGREFPEHTALCGSLIDRMADLLEPFRGFDYYHPAQHGSCSLKAVLPALTGRGYEGMAVADGEAAGREWRRVVHHRDGAPAAEERERVLAALREYCGKDTAAMIEVLEALAAAAGASPGGAAGHS